MRSIRRGWWMLAAVLLALPVIVVLLACWLLAGSRPVYHGEQVVAGLDVPARIVFDSQARPYVRAASVRDALFTQGFLHARERLWQMDLLRRAGSARLAELLGPDLLDSDIALWRAGVPAFAERLASGSSRQVVNWVVAYTAGVNAGMDSLKRRPPEYLLAGVVPEPWRPADSFALGAIMAFDSAGNHQREMLRHALAARLDAVHMAPFLTEHEPDPDFPYPWQPEDALISVAAFARAAAPKARPPGASIRFGSNGWVVAPQRAADGHALFAFDSHDALSLPNLFYEVHLFFANDRSLRGWSVPGLPGVINGFNEHRAWGFTNIGDTQDLVSLVPMPGAEGRFDDGRGGYQAVAEQRQFAVADGDPVTATRWVTPNGPVISDHPPLALRWVAQDLDGAGLDALLGINLAEQTSEFHDALAAFPAPAANITWADRDGHIGFRTIGRLPIRRRGTGLLPVADDGADIWDGHVPAAEMPRRNDPPEGFAAAANARVHDERWPFLVSNDNAPGWRMRRITRVLGASHRHDLDSMVALQNDHYNVQAERDGPRLLSLLDANGSISRDRRIEVVRRQIEAWLEAPVNRADSVAAVVFESWYLALVERLFRPVLGDTLYQELLAHNYLINHAVDRLLEEWTSPWWQGDAPALAARALADAVAGLEAQLGGGPADWRLDRRQSLTLEHALTEAAPVLAPLFNRGPFALGGGHATVGRAGFRYRQPFAVSQAATVRVVLEMGEPPRGRAVMPGGQSGHPLSHHYDDQLPAWLAGRTFDLYPSPETVTGSELWLRPE